MPGVGCWCSLLRRPLPGSTSAAASFNLARRRASCRVPQRTAGPALLPECQSRMWSLYLLRTAAMEHAASTALLGPSVLPRDPNLNNHGRVRLLKLSASKTGSPFCAYCVVLLRNALGWVESRGWSCKKFCFGFVGACSITELAFFSSTFI